MRKMTWFEEEVYDALVVDYLIDKASKEHTHINIDELDEMQKDEAFEMLAFADSELIDIDINGNKASLTEVYNDLKNDSEKLLPWARENADVFSYDEMRNEFSDWLPQEVRDKIDENVELSCCYLDGAIKNKETGEIHIYFTEVDPHRCHEDYLLQSLEFCKGFVDFCTPEKIMEKKNENKQMQSFNKSNVKTEQNNKTQSKGETK